MIYTVTCNPALDYTLYLEKFEAGIVNRSHTQTMTSGGKGINVSAVLSRLLIENTALGFVGGFTGEEIERGAKQMGIRTDFTYLENGISRINVKVRADKESEINAQGPEISEKETSDLLKKLDTLCSGDILVLSGSIPNSLPKNFYFTIMEKLQWKNILVVVDAEQDFLLPTLALHPFLIKPNQHELASIFGLRHCPETQTVAYAKELCRMGATNVLVSMAAKGALLVTEKGDVLHAGAPHATVINSVGAGDSMVAGFLAGWLLEQGSYEKALLLGIASGSASAFSKFLPEKEEIYICRKECKLL